MTKRQFRVLYRQFLFRVVDLELIAPQGDITKLLGQFAALLIFLSVCFSMRAFGLDAARTPRERLLVAAWPMEFSLIEATMLAVGLFAVLSWDSLFPDGRDVLVLAPLPVRTRTLLFAKIAAVGTVLALTVAALNAVAGLVLPFALAPGDGGLLGFVFSTAYYRLMFAYWATMAAAGSFIFFSVLTVQGIAAWLLPRRRFLRVSALLQMAAFCLFLSVYLLQPTPAAAGGISSSGIERLPSYWFLGVFQELNGSMRGHAALGPLAMRAWMGLAAALAGAAVAYALSYFRIVRRIAEEPNIAPAARRRAWLPQFGNSLNTAVMQFCMRTVLRSRQHRVMLAFYFGIGLAAVALLFKAGARPGQQSTPGLVPALLFSSFLIMTVWLVGTRVVFAMPLALPANWIFRVTQVRSAREYMAAIRRPLFVLAVAPVWLGCAVSFLWMWPWRPAIGHLAVLGLWGMIVAYLCLYGFQEIPFTCSYLPGKGRIHVVLLCAAVLIHIMAFGARIESDALHDGSSYTKMLAVLVAAAVAARWRAVARESSGEAIVQFEEQAAPAIMGLGLYRDGVLPELTGDSGPSRR